MREAEEVEALRLPLAASLAVRTSEASELEQPRLLGVQLELELREPLAELAQEPLGLVAVLAPDDEVIGVANDDHIVLRLLLAPLLDPYAPPHVGTSGVAFRLLGQRRLPEVGI